MRKWLLILVFSLLTLLLFIPKIASTSLGKPFFIKALENKTQAQVQNADLDFSWFGPQIFSHVKWTKDQISGELEQLQIMAPFWSFSGPFKLKNGSVRYLGGTIDHITGQIEGTQFDLQGTTLQGHIALKGTVKSKREFQVQVDVKELPLIVLDKRLDEHLGPTANIYGTVQMDTLKGIVDLKIDTPKLNTHLNALLAPDKLTLKTPLTLKYRTPDFKLATLTIEPTGFSFPIPYALEKIEMPQAYLDLGQAKIKSGAAVETLIDLLHSKSHLRQGKVDIWFAPVKIGLTQGTISFQRLEFLLANSIHLCSWGKVNLPTEKLDLFLGLPSDTLQKAFGIKNLSQNYVLKIPVRGTFQNPDIAKNAAATKIAALVAAGVVPKKGILGGIAEVITSPKEDKDVPPANRPFPWENR